MRERVSAKEQSDVASHFKKIETVEDLDTLLAAGLAWWAVNPRRVRDLQTPAYFWCMPGNSFYRSRGNYVENGNFWYIIEED